MKSLVILSMALAFVSCNDLDGTFKAKKDLVFKTKKSIFSSKMVKVKVPAGEHKASIKFSSKTKMKIDIKGVDKKIKIKLPKELSINNRNDEFFVAGEDVKQQYDFEGKIKTTYDRSSSHRGTESCTYTTYIRECEKVCRTNENGRTRCRRRCESVPVTNHGYQDVEYYYSTRETNLKLKVVDPSTSANLAVFKGYDSDTSKVVTWSGSCR
ncbi:hypothetical protein A9Q84_01835 [Halobacteriovorax marinus]|uniref:Lipoprotein n=1 Tax=Halobacteriovorax marinus TaxID=97084 RepID=A0A1Y5FCD7_9BACT|nr:hypothetical protein A9Q84_01835 [Halobacteriovorax marinus]